MTVDVCTEIVIDRGRAEVAAYAADPTRAPEWYENIKTKRSTAQLRLRIVSGRKAPGGFVT